MSSSFILFLVYQRVNSALSSFSLNLLKVIERCDI